MGLATRIAGPALLIAGALVPLSAAPADASLTTPAASSARTHISSGTTTAATSTTRSRCRDPAWPEFLP